MTGAREEGTAVVEEHSPCQKRGAGRESGRTHPPTLSLSTPQSSTRACFGQTRPESRNQRAQAKRSYSTLRAGHRRAVVCVGGTSGNPRGRERPAGQSSKSSTFLAPETGFMEENFFTNEGGGGGFVMIQAHYIYCALISIIITSAPPQTIRH